MSETFAIIIAVAGLILTCGNLIVVFRNIKKTSPAAEDKAWKADTAEKLDNDKRRLDRLERKADKAEELDKLVLKSMQGVLEHLAEGNHTEKMRELSKQITTYLIER